MKNFRNALPTAIRFFTAGIIVATLSACDIGDGNKIESLEIFPANGVAKVRKDDCIGANLAVIATFTDGSLVNFTNRVAWSSSDETLLNITSRPIDGSSIPAGTVFGVVTPGTAVDPSSATPDTVEVTASFFGLSATRIVSIEDAIAEYGLNFPNLTLAAGTTEFASAWGRTNDGIIIDLSTSSEWTIDSAPGSAEASTVGLNSGLIAASDTVTDTNTLMADYCDGAQTASATIEVVADAPSSLEISTTHDQLAFSTTAGLSATAVYSNGGRQDRTADTLFTLNSGKTGISLVTTINIPGVPGNNAALANSADSGVHTITGEIRDGDGNLKGSASGTVDIDVIDATLDATSPYTYTGNNTLVSTSLGRFTVDGLFSRTSDASAYSQDITAQIIPASSAVDASILVLSNFILSGLSAGNDNLITFTSSLNALDRQEVSIDVIERSTATLQSLAVTSTELGSGRHQLNAVATIQPSSGSAFTQDVTAFTTWSSATPSDLHISNTTLNAGLATGINPGCITVTGELTGFLSASSGSTDVDSTSSGACP